MAKIIIVLEDMNEDDIKVSFDPDSQIDIFELDEEELTSAEHLAKRVFAFISTIEADDSGMIQ